MKQLPIKLFRKITPHFVLYNGTQCWQWTGHITKEWGYNLNGYGVVRFEGKVCKVHRVVYELLVGPIPPGLQLDHLCRNRACCNPAHLEVVTHQENVRRGNAGRNMKTKTHCPKGHPYDDNNTKVEVHSKGSARRCIICRKEQDKENQRRYRSGGKIINVVKENGRSLVKS